MGPTEHSRVMRASRQELPPWRKRELRGHAGSQVTEEDQNPRSALNLTTQDLSKCTNISHSVIHLNPVISKCYCKKMLKLSFLFKKKKLYFLVYHVTPALNFPLLIFLIFKSPADLLLCKRFPPYLLKLPLSFFLLFFLLMLT